MEVFIFESVNELTSAYHCGGSLVVIAEDEASARILIAEHVADPKLGPNEEEWASVIRHRLWADNVAPAVYVFPDAGCC